jgi:hypothetical protein
MQKTPCLMDDRCDLRNGLDGARFIVCGHQRYERPPAAGLVLFELRGKSTEIGDAILRDRENRRGLGMEATA